MIQLLLLAAVHVQPVALVTPTDPVVAGEPTDTLVGDSEYEHVIPACVTV